MRHVKGPQKGKGEFCLARKPVLFFCALAFSVLVFAGIYSSSNSSRYSTTTFLKSYPLKPGTLSELLAFSPAQLEKCDIARMNLLCSEGLPGAGSPKMDDCLATLHQWALHVKSETDCNFHQFRDDPANFNNSEGYFRALLLIGVLQQDFNVRYNPAHITPPDSPEPDGVFFADSKDLFLDGLASPRAMGTCISIPVLYVAIGHRLGYPMKLVTARDHLFARWESAGGKERFNIEATGQGLTTPNNNYYKHWPFPITDEEIKANSYLKSLTAVEDLSLFLDTRGHCLRVTGRFGEAREAYLQAQALTPQLSEHKIFLALLQPRVIPSFSMPSANPVQPLHSPMEFVEAMNKYGQQIMETGKQPGQPPPTDPSQPPHHFNVQPP